MDYGKLAYMKVEDLESRLNVKTENKAGSVAAFATYYPVYNLAAGEFPLSALTADGQVNILLKITVRRDKAIKNKKIKLTVNDMIAAAEKVDGIEGESDYIIMANVNVSGSSQLKIQPDEALDCTLIKAQLSVMGGNAILSRKLNDWNADFILDGLGVVAMVKEEYIYLCKISEGKVGEKLACGRGHILDICAGKNEFYIVYCDDNDNMWGVTYGAELAIKSRRYLGGGAACVAVSFGDSDLTIAYLSGNKLYCRICDNMFGGLTEPQLIDTGLSCDNIKFVKHSNSPMLTVTSNGTSYLKLSGDEHKNGDSVTLHGGFEIKPL